MLIDTTSWPVMLAEDLRSVTRLTGSAIAYEPWQHVYTNILGRIPRFQDSRSHAMWWREALLYRKEAICL